MSKIHGQFIMRVCNAIDPSGQMLLDEIASRVEKLCLTERFFACAEFRRLTGKVDAWICLNCGEQGDWSWCCEHSKTVRPESKEINNV